MGSWISLEGVCVPARERVSLKNTTDRVKKPNGEIENEEDKYIQGQDIEPGMDYIYDGPDRAALYELHKMGETSMGEDFRRNMDLLQAVKSRNFKDMDDYLNFIGYDAELAKKKFEAAQAVINVHKPPSKKKGSEFKGGGIDTSGSGNDVKGDFGDAPGGFAK